MKALKIHSEICEVYGGNIRAFKNGQQNFQCSWEETVISDLVQKVRQYYWYPLWAQFPTFPYKTLMCLLRKISWYWETLKCLFVCSLSSQFSTPILHWLLVATYFVPWHSYYLIIFESSQPFAHNFITHNVSSIIHL